MLKQTIRRQKHGFLLELLIDLLFEGSIELSSNKKVPKYIRYPIIVLLILFFTSVIRLMLYLGIKIINKSLWGGLFIIGVALAMLILSILNF